VSSLSLSLSLSLIVVMGMCIIREGGAVGGRAMAGAGAKHGAAMGELKETKESYGWLIGCRLVVDWRRKVERAIL